MIPAIYLKINVYESICLVGQHTEVMTCTMGGFRETFRVKCPSQFQTENQAYSSCIPQTGQRVELNLNNKLGSETIVKSSERS